MKALQLGNYDEARAVLWGTARVCLARMIRAGLPRDFSIESPQCFQCLENIVATDLADQTVVLHYRIAPVRICQKQFG